jgi:L-aminoadipate-semialdehyde dehydrogenase
MADARLSRVLSRLQNPPSISLPTDYPRPDDVHKVVEAVHIAELSEETSLGLLRLVLYAESERNENGSSGPAPGRPSAFHLLLAAFAVLLHRYTSDTDLVVGSSSASTRNPLVLRLSVDPTEPFWVVVRRVQQLEKEAESDALPFETITRALRKTASPESSRPLFRVRFFDETDELKEDFYRSTSLMSDLTVFVTRSPASTRSSLAPLITLRILYNSLLFRSSRISLIVEQLSVLLREVATNPQHSVGSVSLLTPAQRELLPEPTIDLHWCDWKGAITDVFTRNASRWPDRPCVVQSIPALSLSELQKRVTHSYGVIRHATNILAHHLLDGGIQREEVVMVYASRTVELLVAVMAILKIGAIFSVIGKFFSILPHPPVTLTRS